MKNLQKHVDLTNVIVWCNDVNFVAPCHRLKM
jgi:hypothetical protein